MSQTLKPDRLMETVVSREENCQTNNAITDIQVRQANQLSENGNRDMYDDKIKEEVCGAPRINETIVSPTIPNASNAQQTSSSQENHVNPMQIDGIAGCSDTQNVVETESEDVLQLKQKLSIQRLINDDMKRQMDDFRKNVHHLLKSICPGYDGTRDQVTETVQNMLKVYKTQE